MLRKVLIWDKLLYSHILKANFFVVQIFEIVVSHQYKFYTKYTNTPLRNYMEQIRILMYMACCPYRNRADSAQNHFSHNSSMYLAPGSQVLTNINSGTRIYVWK